MRRLAMRFGKKRTSTGDSSTLVSPTTASVSDSSGSSGSPTLDLRDTFNDQVSRHNRLFCELLEEQATGHGDRHRKFVELLQRLDVAFDCAQVRRRDEWRAMQRDLRDQEVRFGDAHFPQAEAARDESSCKGLSYCVERASRYSATYVSDLGAVEELVRLLLREKDHHQVINSIHGALAAFASAARSVAQIKYPVEPPACDTDELLSPHANSELELTPLDLAQLDAGMLKGDGNADFLSASREAFDALQSARESAWDSLCARHDAAISAWDREFLERQQHAVALSATVVMNFRSAESRRLTEMERAWDHFVADLTERMGSFQRKINTEIRPGGWYGAGLVPPPLVSHHALPPGAVPVPGSSPYIPAGPPPVLAAVPQGRNGLWAELPGPFTPANLAVKPNVLERLPTLTREQLLLRSFSLAQDSREEEFNDVQSRRHAQAEFSESRRLREFRNFATQCEARGVMHEAKIASHYTELARAIDRAFARTQNARERAFLSALASVNTQVLSACDTLHGSISGLLHRVEPEHVPARPVPGEDTTWEVALPA
ncbi:hypothetical protein AURDEDRAFT_166926 [Auricularia subglabra TFB-10046 SS5]|nr:hypothetical protein AURDEDRAFT_166926 [Auricularia subglabra TFB-10046 SS5]